VSTILKRASQRRKLFDKLKGGRNNLNKVYRVFADASDGKVATLTFDSLTLSSAVLACGKTAESGVLLTTLRLALELENSG
jgi:hypothetical protein